MQETVSENNNIETFDGVIHNREEILEKMIDDDFYYGYMGKNALSSSAIKTLMKSPNAYLDMLDGVQQESQPLRDGKLFHWCILEPEKFKNLNIVDVASRNTNMFRISEAENGESYTLREKEKAERLAAVLNRNNSAMELVTDGTYEVPAVGMIKGVPFRGKADIILGDNIVDLKTTTDIRNFKYSASKFSYDLQAYLYLQLFPECKQFTFVCIDKNTLDIAIFECSEEFIESGKRKLERGISDYKFFFQEETDIEQYVIRETLFPPYQS